LFIDIHEASSKQLIDRSNIDIDTIVYCKTEFGNTILQCTVKVNFVTDVYTTVYYKTERWAVNKPATIKQES